MANISAAGEVKLEAMNAKGNVDVGIRFTVKHLISAAMYSRQCGKFEFDHKSNTAPTNDFIGMQFSYVSATVILAIAFLEAYANDLLDEPMKTFPKEIPEKEAQFPSEEYEKKNIIEKYQAILSFRGKEPFKLGESPIQEIKTLKGLRNTFVHPHLYWIEGSNASKGKINNRSCEKITRPLKGKFDLNSFLAKENTSIYQYLCYGCAKWAVETAQKFIQEFCTRAELPYELEKFKKDIDPNFKQEI